MLIYYVGIWPKHLYWLTLLLQMNATIICKHTVAEAQAISFDPDDLRNDKRKPKPLANAKSPAQLATCYQNQLYKAEENL
jgi:hypothetical protein